AHPPTFFPAMGRFLLWEMGLDGLHTTFVQKLSLTYYTHNLPFAQSRLAQPAVVHHRCRRCLPLSAGLNYACTLYWTKPLRASFPPPSFAPVCFHPPSI